MLWRLHNINSDAKSTIEGYIVAIPTKSGEQRKSAIKLATHDIEEMEKLVSTMDVEVRTMPASQKTKTQSQIKIFRAEITRLKAELRKAANSMSANERDQLLDGHEDFSAASHDQRQRLLQGTDTLNNSSARIDEAQRIAAESENIGREVLTNLHGQREQIIRSSNSVKETNTYLGESKKVCTTTPSSLLPVVLFCCSDGHSLCDNNKRF